MVKLNPETDSCPCQSGKLIKRCCLRPGGILLPKPFIPKIPNHPIYYRNPRCYLGELGGCSKSISGEHYISESILKILSKADGGLARVEGLPWIKGESIQNIPTKALVSNILCSRHNSDLAGFDAIAKRFLTSINQICIDLKDETHKVPARLHLFNGFDIERWILKTLIGILVSGNGSTDTAPIRNWKPPNSWLRVLYGIEDFPAGWGLYHSMRIGQTNSFKTSRGFEFAPISDSEKVSGAIISLMGITFIFAMATPPDDLKGTILEDHLHRPGELVFKKDAIFRVLKLAWTGREQKTITMNVATQQ